MLPSGKKDRKVFRFSKSMYGLKETERTWNKLLFETLTECSSKEMDTALCVFVGKTAVVMCYVADLILFSKDEGTIDALYRQLNNKFRLKDLVKPKRFLG